jgi:hypothetical protein
MREGERLNYGSEGLSGGIRPPARYRSRWGEAIFVEPAEGGDNPYGCGA